MNITTRHLLGDEILEAIYALDQYSLYPSPPFQDKEEWMKVARERKGVTCYAVLDDETPVSVAGSTAMTQNMRGIERTFGVSRPTLVSRLKKERNQPQN